LIPFLYYTLLNAIKRTLMVHAEYAVIVAFIHLSPFVLNSNILTSSAPANATHVSQAIDALS